MRGIPPFWHSLYFCYCIYFIYEAKIGLGWLMSEENWHSSQVILSIWLFSTSLDVLWLASACDLKLCTLSHFPQVHTHASSSNILTLDFTVLLIPGLWCTSKTFPLLTNLCKFLPCVTSLYTQMRRLEALPKTLSPGRILLGVYFTYTPKSSCSSSGITVQFSIWSYMTGQSICTPSLNFFSPQSTSHKASMGP